MKDFQFEVGQQFRVYRPHQAGLADYYTSGDVFTVVKIDEDGDAVDKHDLFIEIIDLEDGRVELIEQPSSQAFTKADLKDGMIIENREGNRRIVLVSKGVLMGDDGWSELRYLNNDLTNSNDFTNLDIMKVYDPVLFEGCFVTVLKDAGTIDPPLFDRDQAETRQRDKERLEYLEQEVKKLREKMSD